MAKHTLNDLLAQKAALDKQITDFQREQRGDAIVKVKAMMAEYGLTLTDITAAGKARAAAKSGKAGGNGTGAESPPKATRRKNANAGKKVAPKFRNPATGDTWSGRGLKPKWLTAALASGRSLSDFAL